MRRRLILFLLLSVMLYASASAAPARDLSYAAQQSADLIREVQPLADTVAAAALDAGIQQLFEDEAPAPSLLESALLHALQKGVLSFKETDGVVALRPEEAMEAAGRLFTAGGLSGIGLPSHQAVSAEGGLLRFQLPRGDEYTGAHIYDLSLNEEGLMISADIYSLSGIQASSAEAPEDSLRWLGHIEMNLKPRGEAPSGFALSGFVLSPEYQANGYVRHVDGERFELRFPDIFIVPVDDPAEALWLKNADGTAEMSLRSVPGTPEQLREEWLREGLPDGTTVQTGEDGRLMLRGQGALRIAVGESPDGMESCLVLEMTYPVEREKEFSLYWLFMVNSFIVYSNSVG